MNIRLGAFAGVLCATMILGASAANATVIYSNGPINGTLLGYPINFGSAVSDSFTVSTADVLRSADDVGIWNDPGDKLLQVDWSIGSSAFGNDIASGTTSDIEHTLLNNCGGGACGGGVLDVYSDAFDLGNISLAPGTYWITLQNAVVSNGDPAAWDDNNGPSNAEQNGDTIGSESFTLEDTALATVPEPSSLPLLLAGLGLIGGAFYLGSKKARTTTA